MHLHSFTALVLSVASHILLCWRKSFENLDFNTKLCPKFWKQELIKYFDYVVSTLWLFVQGQVDICNLSSSESNCSLTCNVFNTKES